MAYPAEPIEKPSLLNTSNRLSNSEKAYLFIKLVYYSLMLFTDKFLQRFNAH